MDIDVFVSCFGMLQTLFGNIGNDKIAVYRDIFKGWNNEKFKEAVKNIITTFKPTSTEPFPSVSRFYTAAGDDDESRINYAITAVKKASGPIGPYQSVSFGDRALHAAILRFGGWPAVSNWHDDDWKYNESKFMAAYRAELRSNSGPDHLSGLSEESIPENDHKLIDVFDGDEKIFDGKKRKMSFKKKTEAVKVGWNGFQLLLPDKSEKVNKIEMVNDLSQKLSM